MKDSQLFLIVGILLTIDIVIMTTWQVFDPFFRDTYDLRPYVSFLSKKIICDHVTIRDGFMSQSCARMSKLM
jgi:hypothetical protein